MEQEVKWTGFNGVALRPFVLTSSARWLSAWWPLTLLLLLLIPFTVVAQQAPVSMARDVPVELLTIEEVGYRIKAIESASDQVVAAGAELAAYREVLELLRGAAADRESAAGFQQLLDDGGKKINAAQDALEQSQNRILEAPPAGEPLLALEQRLDSALSEHREMSQALSRLGSAQVTQRLRPDEVLSELADAKIELGKLDIVQQPVEDEAEPMGAETQRSLKQARRRALDARINRLELERLSSRPRMDLLDLQIREMQARIEGSQRFIKPLRQRVNQLRSSEAEKERQATEQVQEAASSKHPLIQQQADRNSELGLQLEQVVGDIEQGQQRRNQVVSQLDRVKYNLDLFQQKLSAIELDRRQSELLRTQRRELPDPRRLSQELERRQQEALKTRIEAFKLEDQRQAVDAQMAYAELQLLRPAGVTDAQWRAIRGELKGLFKHQLALLAKLRDALDRYERVVGDINLEQQQLIDIVDSYGALLDRHLAWMPSTRSFDITSIVRIAEQLNTLLSRQQLKALAAQLMGGLVTGIMPLILLLLSLLLLGARPKVKRTLAQMAPRVGNVTKDSYWLTPIAMVLTLLLALPVPLLLVLLALIVDGSNDVDANGGVSQGIMQSAALLLLLQLIRHLFISNGLSEIHFRWREQVVTTLHQQLHWFTPLFILLSMVVTIAEWQAQELYRDTLGRAAFLGAMGGLVLLLHRLFSPGHGLFSRWQPPLALGWRRLCYLLLMGGAVVLMGFAFEGYYYVAYRLARLAVLTTMSGVAIFLAYSLSMRLLQVASRRFALERARAIRQATQDARAAKEAAKAAGEGLPEVSLGEVNLANVNEQTRSLLRVVSILLFAAATIAIWREFMPAVERLDDVVLWQHLVAGTDGRELKSFSLLDLGLLLITLVLTIAAAKNLPALLEITMLRPMALERGNRYAMVSITRYLIYGVGALLIFALVGLEWNDIQWLVAAMGVGIGFGLKEIFANLISGIIILFERPIRIGDTVTLGDVSGTVTRIRIRATTITDWDNKELIVPNQSFIIDPLINWTLSDQVTRIVLTVGIAYGTDTLLAHQVMSDVVNSDPDVMRDPKPTVFFIGFGESSLDFEIRVFVRERVMRMPAQHALYMALERALSDADIEIPFPQRDLHLK